jgi:hypothetical protein
MGDRLADLEARLEGVARELGDIRDRLDRLESRAPGPDPDAVHRIAVAAEVSGEPAAPRTALLAGAVGLVGRTLMALGGAYLLRAVTETGALPPLAGIVAGLAYSGLWLLLADRAAAQGKLLSAVFHGVATAMIAYPLIWETTTRFGLLSHAAAAALVPSLVALGLGLAWRHRLSGIAWIHGLVGLATAFGLLQVTHDLVPFTVALLLIALLVELTALRDRWLGLRWPTALVLDLAVLQTVLIAVRADGPPPGYPVLSSTSVIVVGLALPVLYLGSIATRTLVRSRAVRPFEVLQAAVALLIGFGGTLGVVEFTGAATMAVGAFGLLLGAACYAVAFSFIERREGIGRNFYVYTTFAGLLAIAGAWLMLGPSARAVAWAGLGIIGIWLGGQLRRVTLPIHGLVYLGMAAGAAGLLQGAIDGLLGDGAGPWRAVSPLGLAIGVVAVIAYVILARSASPDTPWNRLLPQAGVAALIALIGGGLVARALAGPLADAPGGSADAAFLATSRTAALAGLAVVLAWAGRRWARPELTWLVYPILAVGGLRLLLEDLPQGRPVTLFISFALYGGALFATPRLVRSVGRGDATGSDD